jgi:hypothetical protein
MIAAAVLSVASMASAAITLSPMSSFGGGDGWLSPAEYPALGSASESRGLSVSPVSGNVIVVTRTAGSLPAPNGPQVRVLDPGTGAELRVLSQTDGVVPNPISGGTFSMSMVDVADDGAIYVGNLATSATANFRVYRWADDSAGTLPTVAFSGGSSLARRGDALAVRGSGASTQIIASGGSALGIVSLTTADGLTYSQTDLVLPNDNQRLGLDFSGANSFVGKESSSALVVGTLAPAGSVNATTLSSAGEAPLDFAQIAGLDVMATVDVNSSSVRVYDMTNPLLPVLLVSANNTTGTLVGNGNGVGDLKFANIVGNTASLYAMSTNQGIQAFTLTIPEPATLGLLAGAGILALRRRA